MDAGGPRALRATVWWHHCQARGGGVLEPPCRSYLRAEVRPLLTIDPRLLCVSWPDCSTTHASCLSFASARLRTLNLVRSINRDLGGSSLQRLLIFFEAAVEGSRQPPLLPKIPSQPTWVVAPFATASGLVPVDRRHLPARSLWNRFMTSVDQTLLAWAFWFVERFLMEHDEPHKRG